MTRRRHLAAPLAPVAALLLAACASSKAPPPSAPAAESTLSMTATSADAAPNDLEGQLAALGAAEAQLDLVISRSPLAARSAVDAKKKDGNGESEAPNAPRKAEETRAQKGVATSADSAATADPCATACSALASMERATKHLCELTGDGDARCDNARSRVSGATERVSASCPACPESR
jgi:hypothetical protein